MKTKSLVSLLLLAFVAVSIAMAIRKVGPSTGSGSAEAVSAQTTTAAATPVGLQSKLAESSFNAVYFHAPHRCPTCRKIESFSQEALTPEIEAGELAWQIADYTSDENSSFVDQFKVFTSTVVLVEMKDGEVVRWKNLEEVWNHTSDQADFTAFINEAWSEFKTS
ncbi:nitrophenyl compound nitroreductase subunit ArsF family protein [Rhodopirellula islandica]|nr:nitrophenyl compound nitroreductase subunit ArsF family protein [Rhodopirellula islandica]